MLQRRPVRLALVALLAGLAATVTQAAQPDRSVAVDRGYLAQPRVQAFIDELVQRHGFERAEIERLLGGVKRQDRVLEVIQRPAEAKPWREYRQIFLTQGRIEGGVEFWQRNEALLARAEKAYGVPAAVVVAIIGVETLYGRHTGGFPVLDTLTTLGFDYPQRASFFRGELEDLLLLAREESLDPARIEGSYAGAMGKGQFIASSYRAYAVDFDGDGKRDLLDSTADAIGSVANYLHRHDWRTGQPVALPAKVAGSDYRALLDKGMEPSLSAQSLAGHGVTPKHKLAADQRAALFELDGAQGPEYWLGLHNFYVITRYNRSPLYALAVYQLSERIHKARARRMVEAGS